MQGSGGLILSMPTPIEQRTASRTVRKPGAVLGPNSLIPPSTSHVAFCVWPICPATRSTGLAGMKQSFGARPARSCLLSRHWIVANHKREGAVSVSVADNTFRPTAATIIELPDVPIYAIDAKLGREGRAISNSSPGNRPRSQGGLD
jgi:hypothetical protein